MTSMIRSSGYVDPGWEHGVAQDDRKKKVRCNYCGKVVSGGIYRLKQHLARISGEVTCCDKAPDDVRLKMRENLEGCRAGKKSRQTEYDEQSYLNFNSTDDVEEEEHVRYRKRGKRMSGDRDLVISMTPLRSLGYVDPGWEHGIPQDDRKKKVKCNYCEKIVSGGINRFKQHLARIPGEVAPCKSAPEEVYITIKENMKWHRTGRRHRRPDTKEMFSFYLNSDNEDEEQEEEADYSVGKDKLELGDRRLDRDLNRNFKGVSTCSGSEPLSKRPRFDANVSKAPTIQMPVSSRQAKAGPFKKSRREITSAIFKFFYHAGVPSHAANSPYFHKMLELVVVEEMGEENVVQVITQNTPSYRAAGKMIEDRRRNLFWTPCAAYCIDQILDDFMRLNRVRDCIEKGQKITKFIYNRIWVLNLMKKEFSGGEELLRPSVTRSASSFTTLLSLLDNRIALRRMFQSNKWMSSRYAKLDDSKEVKNIVYDSSFWRKVQFVKKSVDPIIEVLQKITSDESLSMPFIYNDMYRAKLAIKINHNDDARKYEPFWSVIDNHWSSLFHHPLYLAAYFLNPSYRYRPDFILHPDVVRGLNACIVRLEPDSARRVSASMQMSDFGSAKADFGTDLAISTRSELDPAAWWQQHGINCLELQSIAVRILSQSCSSFGCEHNWSIHDQIYEQKQNRLAQKRLNETIYVHYNLRLRERQMRKRSSNSMSLDTVLQEDLLYDWIVETEKQALQEDEEILYTEMEHEDTFENDIHDFDDGNIESRKGSMEMTVLADVVEPLDDDDPAQNDDMASGDDQGLNFIDDDTTE
ncbi:hAT dimerisation domain-containing protein [Striga hermonthica]|uniref:HAT dimerisation domain-containing protein n=1 Tax=Striga hermonthica TaxID=68872 RepID=A0A9N7P0K1_STRHE|nr:hAT dimerisation domain-containing protein [Striga hermonthica]